jgi:O-antigen/teichoic acid export membrane protein
LSSQEAKEAGRGVVYIAGAKLYFMIAGAAIVFRLPHVLDEALYGAYLLVVGVASVVNNVVVTATIQAVSRFTAQMQADPREVQRAGFRMHLRIGVPIAVSFAAVVAPVMGWFFHDPAKVGPLALAALIVAGYSFYAVFVGTANGLRQFHKQAGLDVTFATLRAVGIIGLASVGFGVYGAVGGWVGAVAAILAVSAVVIGVPRAGAGSPQPLRPLASFFGSVALYLILLNLIMYVDLFLLKRLTADALLAEGMSTAAAADAADAQVAYYGAAQQLARLSYQAILAATFVIFPLISRATFENDRERTVVYVRTTMRYSLIFSAGFAVVFVANPHDLMALPFRVEYADNAAAALVALAVGHVAFALFAISGAILNGAGLTRPAIASGAVTVVVAVVGNAVAIPQFAPEPAALVACGVATAGAMSCGMAVGAWSMRRRLGAFLPAATALRTGVAAAAAIGLGRLLPVTGRWLTIVDAALVGVVFVVVLVVTGELSRSDLRAVASLRKGS